MITVRVGDDGPAAAAPRPGTGLIGMRERAIARLSNVEIARHLTISHLTAGTHVSRAMTRLGACDRAPLVVFAHESGVVVPGTRRS